MKKTLWKSALRTTVFVCLLLAGCNSSKEEVKPTPEIVPPSGLVYSPSAAEITIGQSFNSSAPTLSGTSPFTFSLSVAPQATGFSIAANGTVSGAGNLALGIYTLTVTARNAAGQTTGTLTVTVKEGTPEPEPKITYAQVRPILSANGCIGCHAGFGSFSGARSSITGILDRVQRQPGQAGFMPQGGQPLSTAEVNTLKKWVEDGLTEN